MQKYISELKYEISQHTDCLSKDEKNLLINLIIRIKDENKAKQIDSKRHLSLSQPNILKFQSFKEINADVSKKFSNDENISPMYTLVKFIFSLPISKKICNFFKFPLQNIYTLFPFFKFNFFKKGNLIFDTIQNKPKCFYILLSGEIEYLQAQYPNLLKNLIRKIVELKLEDYFEQTFNIKIKEIEVFSEESEKLMYKKLLNNIKNSDLDIEIKKNLLKIEIKPPKQIILNQITETCGLREIVSEIRKIKIKSKATALSNVYCIYIEKDILTKYLGTILLDSLHSNYDFIGKILPFLKEDYQFTLLMRKVEYLFPFKGQIIYNEGTKGHFFYLIFQGECTLNKKIYIDSNKEVSIYPKNNKLPFNLNLISIKKYNVISLKKGTFAGSELLYSTENLYDSTLVINSDDTILIRFDVVDYKDDFDILQRVKECLFQSFIVYQNNLKELETNLNENERIIITYRNVFKKLINTSIENNFINKIISKIHNKPLKSIIPFQKIKKDFSLSPKRNNIFIKKQSLPFLNSDDTKREINFFDKNLSISRKLNKNNFFISSLNSPINENFKNNKNNDELKRKIEKEKMKNLKFLKKINRNTKEIKQSIKKLNKKKLLRNSSLPCLKDSLYQSLSNFEQRNLSYLTPSFKIPMFSALNN